ncbi:MAG: hypothetical protein ABIQ60_16855 [Burkholderiaceae bacterium]
MTLCFWVPAAQALPRVPSADGEVLETLPLRAGDASARELAGLRDAAARDPSDAVSATKLAERYFELAMARGDPRYVGYAEAVVNRFAAPLPASLRVARGQLRQYRHQFDAALADFAAALALDPELASAHAWRGAIFLVQARYDAARAECAALQQLGRRALFGACLGLAQAYTGELEAAQASLRQALELSADPDSRLWLSTRLGEVAAWRGQDAQAERHYRDALSLGRDDGYLLAAWSDFLLDAGRADEVVRQLASWESSDPLLLRLTEAEVALKLPGAAGHVQVLDDRFAAAKLRGDTTHRAEEARYQLALRGDARTAVRLASENYAVQREPRDARILLEAAIAARDPAAAEPARAWLRSSGFEDARLRRLAQASVQTSGSEPAPSGAPR